MAPALSPRVLKAAREMVFNPKLTTAQGSLRAIGVPEIENTRSKRRQVNRKLALIKKNLDGRYEGRATNNSGSASDIVTRGRNDKTNGDASSPPSTSTSSIARQIVAHPTSVVTPPTRSNSTKVSVPGNIIFDLEKLQPSTCDPKGCRRTPKQVLAEAKVDHMYKRKKMLAYMEAYGLYKSERVKNLGLSSQKVADLMGNKYGVMVAPTTVRMMVQQGRPILQSTSYQGKFSRDEYNVLKGAFVSMITLHQAGPENEISPTVMKAALFNLLSADPTAKQSCGKNLFERLRKDCASVLNADKEYFVELARKQWMNNWNMNTWFDAFKDFVVSNGFATDDEERDVDGNLISEVTFSEEQKERIINLDETKISEDGSDGGIGGRPSMIISSAGPRTGTAVNKSCNSSTLIGAVTARGSVLPPHIQFSSDAKDDENKQVRTGWILNLPRGFGKFGNETWRDDYAATIGCNEKGGMDSEEFLKYLESNVIPLYPDAEDVPGKRVLIKCDSGPGRLDVMTLVMLRLKGFYLFPTVPNATSVMQECDLLYGLFKSMVRANLQQLLNERIKAKRPARICRHDLGVIVNGRKAKGGLSALPSPFMTAFSTEKVISSWNKVGACPLNRNCLHDPKVQRVIIEGSESQVCMRESTITSEFIVDIEEQYANSSDLKHVEGINHACVVYLNHHGFFADGLKRDAPVIAQKLVPNTVKTMSREDRVLAIAKSKEKVGDKFIKTGGMALNCDDAFYAVLLNDRRQMNEKNVQVYTSQLEALERQSSAQKIITSGKTVDKMGGKELTEMLKWKMTGKNYSKFTSKKAKLEQWEKVKNTEIPTAFHPGTAPTEFDEKGEISNMTMADTLVGIAKKKRRSALILELSKMENFDEVVTSARSKKMRKASADTKGGEFMDAIVDVDEGDNVPWIGVPL